MQYIISSIINIDKEAENYEKVIKEEIQHRNKVLSDEISNLEKIFQAQIKDLKEQIMEDSIREAELKVKRISEEKNAGLQKVNEKFLKNKDHIIDSVFQKIINS